MLISEKAVGTDQAQKYVLTLTPTNTVAYQSVVLGPTIDGMRIIRSGVTGGEQIVINGMQHVRPGMTVKAEQASKDVLPLAKR
jgi:hypothetical protein